MIKGWLSEIFDSIQGEGIYLGVRQIFLRFAGCNLYCKYCDTPYALRRQKYCRVFNFKSNTAKKIKNPLSPEEIIKTLKINMAGTYHSASLTGGEPLLQADFLELLIPQLKSLGLKIYLETNGIMPEVLNRVVRNVDFIAMDIKLPTATNQEFWKEHKEFLKLGNGKIFVKIVITPETKKKEIERSCNLIAETDRKIPLVLQPVFSKLCKQLTLRNLIKYQQVASRALRDVRIIPQLHKFLNIP